LAREHARLDSVCATLEAQRCDLSAALTLERASLEAARAARIAESDRFLRECEAERRRLGEERAAAWRAIDSSAAEAAASQAKAGEFEARATAAMRAATDAGEKARAAAEEVDAFYAQISEYAPLRLPLFGLSAGAPRVYTRSLIVQERARAPARCRG